MTPESPQTVQNSQSGLTRFWTYQKERFPLFQTSLLVFFFTSATLCVSAQLSSRGLPPLWSFIAAWLSVLIIFFQMRACDEYKDLETDTLYRPERPIPRGLIKLKTIISLAFGASLIAIMASFSISPKMLLPLGLIWAWLYIMTKEFFVPEWLVSKPFLYLVSHMMIMPIIDLYISSAEWIIHDQHPPHGLWIFLVLSFLNGCVLEFGRKVWAPENEREGVQTYSRELGPAKAAWLWAGFCTLAAGFLLAMIIKLNTPLWVFIPAFLILLYIFCIVWKFSLTPNPALQKRIDAVSGIWVLICYALAGFAPFLLAWGHTL